MWDCHPELEPFVQTEWGSKPVCTSVQEVHEKLQALGENLHSWDRHTFGSVKGEIKQLKRQLEALKNVPGRVGPSRLEIKVTDRLVELYQREEIMCRQRSRVDWLTYGDKNTKYFQMRASMRRRKNKIKSLTKPDGQIVDDENEVEGMTTDFYKKPLLF